MQTPPNQTKPNAPLNWSIQSRETTGQSIQLQFVLLWLQAIPYVRGQHYPNIEKTTSTTYNRSCLSGRVMGVTGNDGSKSSWAVSAAACVVGLNP